MPPRRRAKPPEWRREGVRRTIFPLRKDKTRPKIAKIREIEMKIPTAKAALRRAGSLALPTEAGSRPGTLVPRPSGKGPGRGSPFLVSGASAGKNPNHFSRRHARREKFFSRSDMSGPPWRARRQSGALSPPAERRGRLGEMAEPFPRNTSRSDVSGPPWRARRLSGAPSPPAERRGWLVEMAPPFPRNTTRSEVWPQGRLWAVLRPRPSGVTGHRLSALGALRRGLLAGENRLGDFSQRRACRRRAAPPSGA